MINYRLANPADNEQLIALTALSGMEGVISLRIERQPDFFRLVELRGESRVFVAETNNTIIGCLCVSLQQVWVGGQVVPLYYIGDFKVEPVFRNKGIGLELCNRLADYVVACDADLAFLNVAAGNSKPLSFFKNRPQVPDFENIGNFIIHQFIARKKKAVENKLQIEAASATVGLLQFLNDYYRTYELGMVFTDRVLDDSDIWVARSNGKILAVMCLFDTMAFKQNVVTGISRPLKVLLAGFSVLYRISGIARMPVINKPVGMMYIRYLAMPHPDKRLVRLMINHARQAAYDKSYSFVSIGLHEKDPLHKYFKGMLRLSFKSVGMLLSVKNNRSLVEKVKNGVPFEDYSLV